MTEEPNTEDDIKPEELDDIPGLEIVVPSTMTPDPTGENPEFDALLGLYDQTLRTIGNLREIAMRRAKLGETLDRLEVEEKVWWIDQLIRGALWGRSPEIDAMLACAGYLIRLRLEDDYDALQEMYIAAHESNRESILFLLRDYPPHRSMAANARLQEVRLPIPRDVTLGERRSLARGSNRAILERLLLENSPLVIEKLMGNPNLNVRDVLVVTTRRPTKPELLMPVVMADKWFSEHRIRESIVRNPFAYTGVALKLMPTLHIDVLRKLKYAGDLHPTLSEAAKMLIKLREQRTAPWGH